MITLQLLSAKELAALEYAIAEGIANAYYDSNEDIAGHLTRISKRVNDLKKAEAK